MPTRMLHSYYCSRVFAVVCVLALFATLHSPVTGRVRGHRPRSSNADATSVESILPAATATPKSPSGEPIASRNLSGGLSFSRALRRCCIEHHTRSRNRHRCLERRRHQAGDCQGCATRPWSLPNTPLAVVMATSFFKALTPSDQDAVVAYLRYAPAIRNEVPTPAYRAPQVHQPYPDAEVSYSDARMSDPISRALSRDDRALYGVPFDLRQGCLKLSQLHAAVTCSSIHHLPTNSRCPPTLTPRSNEHSPPGRGAK